jgi:hypothetical protein
VKVWPIQIKLRFFFLVRRHVRLKEVVSWLERGQKDPFLREKRPFKKVTHYFISSSLLTTRNKVLAPFRLEKLQYDQSSFLFGTRRLVQLVFIICTRLRLARIRRDVLAWLYLTGFRLWRQYWRKRLGSLF